MSFTPRIRLQKQKKIPHLHGGARPVERSETFAPGQRSSSRFRREGLKTVPALQKIRQPG